MYVAVNNTEAHSEPCQIGRCETELLAKITTG